MIEFSTNQWAIVALVLVLGFVLGLASRSGGGKYRRLYDKERADHAALRRDHDARVEAANLRIAELERNQPAIGAGTGGAIAAAASGRRDDLSLIRGIGRTEETRLNEAGIHGYRDINGLSPDQAAALEARMGYAPGRIQRESWIHQAKLLEGGRKEEHRRWLASGPIDTRATV